MKNKIFLIIIILNILFISGSAAFYSIFGLSKLFAGAAKEIIILATSLEIAKLLIISFLYQYWNNISKILKTYFLLSVFILMIITSAGIYGFLSSAYQDINYKIEIQNKNIEIIDNKISFIKKDIFLYEKQLQEKESRINRLIQLRLNLQTTQDTIINRGWNTYNIRKQIRETEKEIKKLDSIIYILNDSIQSKKNKIYLLEIQKNNIQNNSNLSYEVGPLKYISKLVNKPIDVIVNWYILLIIFVFDPLAISLTISVNFIIKRMINNKKIENEKINNDKKIKNEEIKNNKEIKNEKINKNKYIINNENSDENPLNLK